MSGAKTNLATSQELQLEMTLQRMELTLVSWVEDRKTFKNISMLATKLGEALGYDRSLFLVKPKPGKSGNQGKHREILEKFATQLGVGSNKVPYEVLERQLQEAKSNLAMIEDAYRAGLKAKPSLLSADKPITQEHNFFYEFEQTCLVLQKILNHPLTGFEIIEGKLYDTAPIVGEDVLICESTPCKPFLDWESGKGSFSRKRLKNDGF